MTTAADTWQLTQDTLQEHVERIEKELRDFVLQQMSDDHEAKTYKEWCEILTGVEHRKSGGTEHETNGSAVTDEIYSIIDTVLHEIDPSDIWDVDAITVWAESMEPSAEEIWDQNT